MIVLLARSTAVLFTVVLLIASANGEATDKDKNGSSDDLDTLIKNLRKPSVKTRLKALESLGNKGEEAKPAARALCEATQDQSPQVAAAALFALQKVCPELYKPLSTLILEPLPDKRLAAIKELGLMGADAAPVASVLASTLRKELAQSQSKPNPVVQYRKSRLVPPTNNVVPTNTFRLEKTAEACFNALQAIKPQDDGSVQILITIAGPLNKLIIARREAIVTLNLIADEDEKLRKRLLPVLRSGLIEPTDIRLMATCVELLGNYGKLATAALPRLRLLKLSTEESIREAANKAVDQIENE